MVVRGLSGQVLTERGLSGLMMSADFLDFWSAAKSFLDCCKAMDERGLSGLLQSFG